MSTHHEKTGSGPATNPTDPATNIAADSGAECGEGVQIPRGRIMDCVTLGRANMDLYTESERTIESTRSFEKSVGGSPANIAAAMARLGMRTGIITRVADDPVGTYVTGFLQGIGVDTSRVVRDGSGVSTSVAFAETRSRGSRTVLYRNNAADLKLHPIDIDRDYIAGAALLLISGQALSRSPSREAAMTAIAVARAAGTVVALDIDYRPYSWVDPESASVVLMSAAQSCEIVIGTREEFDALEYLSGTKTEQETAGGTRSNTEDRQSDDQATAANLLAAGASLVVIKHGEAGSRAWSGDGRSVTGPAYPVVPAKPYGAGDAFAGALLYGLSRDASLKDSLKIAAAAASINISRTRCAEDMATREEISTFLKERNDALSSATL